MTDETAYCSNPDCNHARIGHFAPKGCMMPGCHCTRTYGNEDSGADATSAASSPSTPATSPVPASSTSSGNSFPLPADCIVSPCKVSPGRWVPVIVPLKLSKAEAERLIAFIMQQTDDEPGVTVKAVEGEPDA